MATDLERAFEALKGKQDVYTLLWKYYDGEAPMVYVAERLREIYKGVDIYISENWCAVVIDSVAERIDLVGFSIAENTEAQNELARLWNEVELDLESDDAHKAALVLGEAFIVAWKDEATGETLVYYHDPRLMHLFYDPNNPKRKTFAAKWWDDDSGKRRITLYYPDRLDHYVSKGKGDTVAKAEEFEPAEPSQTPNPWGEIPVFHFRPERRKVKSDLKDAVPIQDAINMLVTNLVVAGEFSALPQKYVISNVEVDGKLKNKPNGIWDIPAGDGMGQQTSVGQFQAADLTNFTTSLDRFVSSLSAITRIPKHHFIRQGGEPSGEALIAMEAPLVKKAKDRIKRFSVAWRQLAAFLLKLNGKDVPQTAIEPVWERPETVQPMTQAQVRQASVSTGIPLKTALRDEGWTPAEIAQMEQDKAEEQQQQQLNLAQAMLSAQAQFNSGVDDEEE